MTPAVRLTLHLIAIILGAGFGHALGVQMDGTEHSGSPAVLTQARLIHIAEGDMPDPVALLRAVCAEINPQQLASTELRDAGELVSEMCGPTNRPASTSRLIRTQIIDHAILRNVADYPAIDI